jgi:hypothetical protein
MDRRAYWKTAVAIVVLASENQAYLIGLAFQASSPKSL